MRGWIVPKRAIRHSRRTCGGVLGSCSIPRSAPCRARWRPHLSRRQTCVTGWVTALRLPPRVNGDEAAHDRLDLGAAEAGAADHGFEFGHRRKAADRFDEVAVAVLVV